MLSVPPCLYVFSITLVWITICRHMKNTRVYFGPAGVSVPSLCLWGSIQMLEHLFAGVLLREGS